MLWISVAFENKHESNPKAPRSLAITGTNVVNWDSRRLTRPTVPRCEVQMGRIEREKPNLLRTKEKVPKQCSLSWIN